MGADETITGVTSATPEGGVIVATVPADGGNFSVAHNMWRILTCYDNKLTSYSIGAEQAAPDDTNLHLQGADTWAMAKVELW